MVAPPKEEHIDLLSTSKQPALKTYIRVTFYGLIRLYWEIYMHMQICLCMQ